MFNETPGTSLHHYLVELSFQFFLRRKTSHNDGGLLTGLEVKRRQSGPVVTPPRLSTTPVPLPSCVGGVPRLDPGRTGVDRQGSLVVLTLQWVYWSRTGTES